MPKKIKKMTAQEFIDSEPEAPKIEKKESLRAGVLTQKEKDFISQNIHRIPIEVIAKQLNRSISLVCVAAGIDEDTVKEFRYSPDFDSLKSEFTDEEMVRFEYKYLQWLTQFKQDVTASEKTQILLAIKYDILMSRCLQEQKKIMEDTKRWEKTMNDILAKETLDENDAKDFAGVAQTIATQRNIIKDQTRSFTELTAKHKDLMQQLKATREQRIKNIENSKRDLMSLMKSLLDDKFREEEGERLAMVKMASEKEFERLSKIHKYVNGEKDRPILNAETAQLHDNIDDVVAESQEPINTENSIKVQEEEKSE